MAWKGFKGLGRRLWYGNHDPLMPANVRESMRNTLNGFGDGIGEKIGTVETDIRKDIDLLGEKVNETRTVVDGLEVRINQHPTFDPAEMIQTGLAGLNAGYTKARNRK